MEKIQYSPIGVIRSTFKVREGTPRQAAGTQHITGTIEIFDAFRDGIMDLNGFSHIMVIFHMHLIDEVQLEVSPPWSEGAHGVFACCAPHRPNPIGISVVKLEKIEQTTLHISGMDMVDQSPVLDIKPYIPDLYPSSISKVKIGWLSGKTNDMLFSKTGER